VKTVRSCLGPPEAPDAFLDAPAVGTYRGRPPGRPSQLLRSRDLPPPPLSPSPLQVQENVIDLVGRIADRGHEYVPAREWMRICFELLDMLKAHKKAIRRATVNTFGYIAKAIGPQDVLVTLLNNLKVQERQNRVCTTVAIAIVSESCQPFTVLPALMNEYRTPELNVQNGVLKVSRRVGRGRVEGGARARPSRVGSFGASAQCCVGGAEERECEACIARVVIAPARGCKGRWGNGDAM
jgi:hypothetical protein